MIVRSGSMEPTIRAGSIVFVRPTNAYKVGDIITFGPWSTTNPPTTHRIVKIQQRDGVERYVTQGDANNEPDMREVAKSDVVGKVLLSVPYMGYVVAAVQRPYGFLLVAIIPAIIILIEEGKKIIAAIRTKNNHEA